jgi:hypothetical protein
MAPTNNEEEKMGNSGRLNYLLYKKNYISNNVTRA